MSKRYNLLPEARIKQLQQIQLKKKTEAKCNWAVSAYNDWRQERLETFNYDAPIYFADLCNLDSLTKENFQHAMCRFIPEVQKRNGNGDYPAKTLYQMVVSLQKYLSVNKINWKLVEGPDFEELHTVLDNIMREHTQANIGVTPRQADVISYKAEEKLWIMGILGEDTPDKLHNTVLFLLGMNVLLRAVEEHYYLRHLTSDGTSQISFETNDQGVKCLVYREDSCTKTHDGGLKDMRNDRKIVWVYPNKSNVNRCPVRLVEKYLALCPKQGKKPNFYLQSKIKPTPIQWYQEQVVGQNSISKVVKTLMKDAEIPGFFTNHSTRRTGSTRLFRGGGPEKTC